LKQRRPWRALTLPLTPNPAKKIKQLASCAYIDNKENIFLLGPVGVGKSHIAQALGHLACRMGYDVLYTKAAKMFRYLNGGRADNSCDRRIRGYTAADLLIIDDFGLKPLTPVQSDDLYEVINDRYMKKSIIFTSNRSIEDWQGLFPDPIIANSAMDRIAHNAHQIVMTGESYRNRGRDDKSDFRCMNRIGRKDDLRYGVLAIPQRKKRPKRKGGVLIGKR
jgi:DNA replication protein DnaC